MHLFIDGYPQALSPSCLWTPCHVASVTFAFVTSAAVRTRYLNWCCRCRINWPACSLLWWLWWMSAVPATLWIDLVRDILVHVAHHLLCLIILYINYQSNHESMADASQKCDVFLFNDIKHIQLCMVGLEDAIQIVHLIFSNNQNGYATLKFSPCKLNRLPHNHHIFFL